jgi:acylphosphatase
MHTHTLIGWTLAIAASMTCVLVATEPVSAKSDAEDQKITAVSGKVTGSVQQVGFRALIQKQAIRYNLARSTGNNSDKSVRFTLQGDGDRIKAALKTIRKGAKRSSNVNVRTSFATVDSNLTTFTVVGWTPVSRGINHPYDLVFFPCEIPIQ